MPYYKTAQICEKGHLIVSNMEDNPATTEKFCHICGSKSISACPECANPIRGSYAYSYTDMMDRNRDSTVDISNAPSYCVNCGNPYPWTITALKAAKSLIDESELSKEDKKVFNDNINSIVADSPETPLAANRIAKVLGKAGVLTANAAKEILISIAAEGAKRLMWP